MTARRLLSIVGPTAVGKSDLALRLAKSLDGEIISADSRQIYRHMDIGTAKPAIQDRLAVPHHLVDFIDPDEHYSLALFLRQANEAILNVQDRSKLPLLVGGSGQYVWGLLEGWQVPEASPDNEIRQRLEIRARSEGADALYDELARLDKVAAARIDGRNVRRVIRALEVCYSSGAKPDGPRKKPPPYQTKIIGLTMAREELYKHIDKRVDRMIEQGWVDEVRHLLEMGYGSDLPSMSSFGYGELVFHLKGELPLEEAVQKIKHKTHRFARQQYTWFKIKDPRIKWFDASDSFETIERELNNWLEATG